MSVALEIVDQGLEDALLKIEGIQSAPRDELMDGIGRLIQESTRDRIENTKTAPDGTAWQANIAGTSILFSSGALSRSIDYIAANDNVIVGSGLIYARIHQNGGKIVPRNAKALFFSIGNNLVQVQSVTMPARTYLGLSSEDRRDIVEAAEDWLGSMLQ